MGRVVGGRVLLAARGPRRAALGGMGAVGPAGLLPRARSTVCRSGQTVGTCGKAAALGADLRDPRHPRGPQLGPIPRRRREARACAPAGRCRSRAPTGRRSAPSPPTGTEPCEPSPAQIELAETHASLVALGPRADPPRGADHRGLRVGGGGPELRPRRARRVHRRPLLRGRAAGHRGGPPARHRRRRAADGRAGGRAPRHRQARHPHRDPQEPAAADLRGDGRSSASTRSSGSGSCRASLTSARWPRAVRHEHERWDGQGYPDGISSGPDPGREPDRAWRATPGTR